MKVLYVISGNSSLYAMSPFIREQVVAINLLGVEVDYFQIHGKGIRGYLSNIQKYYKKIEQYKPDIVHAHYGLSGLFANLQRSVPVVTTFHGGDINEYYLRPFSLLSILLSAHSNFVSEELARKVSIRRNSSIIPCSVDLDIFHPIAKDMARDAMQLDRSALIVLFSSSFDLPVKNYALALEAVTSLQKKINLIELKGYSRQEVNLLLSACDVALMTSKSEGSPQFIKEAMACNCVIVTTDVGDVKSVIGDTPGCYVTRHSASDVANAIDAALAFDGPREGRDKVRKLTPEVLAKQIVAIYERIRSKRAFS